MVITRLLTTMALMGVFGSPVAAQSGYESELTQLTGTLRSLMVRTERLRFPQSSEGADIRKELFELSKRLHLLEEEAMSADLVLRQRTGTGDRQLILAASISKTLDLAQSLVSNYLDTGSKEFWSSSQTAAQLARTLQSAGR